MTLGSLVSRTLLATLLASVPTIAAAKGGHCEIKKDGKTKDFPDIKSRKECKKKGGKWVKDHDHNHDDGEDHDHEHEEVD
jgi:hypothetical protein